jgi:predicted dehydrogenase
LKQVLINSGGALVARMPAPIATEGSVLVRVRYSLVSTGTEIAALRPISSSISGASNMEKAAQLSSSAAFYLGKAARNPRKAAERLAMIARGYAAKYKPKPKAPSNAKPIGSKLVWDKGAATAFEATERTLKLSTDNSPASYQAVAQPIAVPKGYSAELDFTGTLSGAVIGVGILDGARSRWLSQTTIEEGSFAEKLHFNVPEDVDAICPVIFNANAGVEARLDLTDVALSLNPPSESGLPANEMDQQGWGVGYSVAGEVVAVGPGVDGFSVGDFVACGGAGQANHAEYVSVKKNLVVKVPHGLPLEVAATATVGSIAMQGVRRADPRLGEVVCVIGLGLIGAMTVQIAAAAGAKVVGVDVDPGRVEKARKLGIHAATADPAELPKLVRDLTGGQGADQTIITAASKSHALINQAMEVTRRRGRVVIVGDIGLKPERTHFYRKEIDLLMSTSYGPGRYDPEYEEAGRDYPYAYVRWTQNRNMSSYLELAATGKIDIASLIEMKVPVSEAPGAYKQLADSAGPLPLGVVLEYPDDTRKLPEPADAAAIRLLGHRGPRGDKVNYALVGAGAFGTAMLVPQMDKRADAYFLKAVVSRDAVRGGNFARGRRIETLATDYQAVLDDPEIDLVVIATRHDEHPDQVARALKAGKAVFVEKPLAVDWAGLEKVQNAYWEAARETGREPVLMVGFNRRFAPAIEALRGAIANRRGPLVINYRLNGGFIPGDHWIQRPQGGGRNIGEACHMYDLFRSLAGAPVASASITAINPGDSAYLKNDNFAMTASYEDGSVGNLVYTALGPKEGLPKERIEIFCDGEAYIVDDFKALIRASDGNELWKSRTADKGHFEELSLLADGLVNKTGAPIAWSEIIETTALSLHLEDMIHGRIEE